ncbi:MAG: hypothetical protein IJR85_07220 [Synergistaceae bacterium]|nr:hypothetical protein [Synergistaceae bacterium]
MKKFLVIMMVLAFAGCGYCADVAGIEREAWILRAELNMLGSSGDPFEREAILRKMIDRAKGTEEGERAYWDLADLYLDGFPEEMRQEATEMLELCLRTYPKTRRSVLVKCRLVDLYDVKDSRRAELVRQLKNDSGLPSVLKSSLK